MATTAIKKDTTTTDTNFGGETKTLDNAQGFVAETYEKALDIADTVVRDVKDAAAHIPETIRKHPMESLLVGFGAGFLVALLGQKLLNSRD